MAKWTAFPHLGDYPFDTASVRRDWARQHHSKWVDEQTPRDE